MKRSMLVLLIIGVLAIVCIGFFMFTTTMSSPTKMDLYIPKESGKDSVDKFNYTKKKLILILLKDEKVFGYYGDFITGGKIVPSNETNNLIEDGWKMFSKDSMVVVIKPTKGASYRATVDILDQMAINKIEKYSMNDLAKNEKEFLKTDE
jgi:biopolymer transport protein ExbD